MKNKILEQKIVTFIVFLIIMVSFIATFRLFSSAHDNQYSLSDFTGYKTNSIWRDDEEYPFKLLIYTADNNLYMVVGAKNTINGSVLSSYFADSNYYQISGSDSSDTNFVKTYQYNKNTGRFDSIFSEAISSEHSYDFWLDANSYLKKITSNQTPTNFIDFEKGYVVDSVGINMPLLNLTKFVAPPPPTPVPIPPINQGVADVNFSLILGQVVSMLPIVLPVLIGFIALRKGLLFVKTALQGG